MEHIEAVYRMAIGNVEFEARKVRGNFPFGVTHEFRLFVGGKCEGIGDTLNDMQNAAIRYVNDRNPSLKCVGF